MAESCKSLFKIINGLRYFGVGTKVKRSIYRLPETYWIITKVNLSPDQNHGTVFGRLVWRGKAKAEDTKIPSTLKKEWSIVSLPDYKTFKATSDEINSLIPTNEERVV